MEAYLARGGVVALLTIGAAAPVVAQGAGASAGTVRRDTIVRVIDPAMRVKLDSLFTLRQIFERQSAMSDRGMRIRSEIDAMWNAIMADDRGQRIFVTGRGEGPTLLESHAKGWIGITTDAPTEKEGNYVRYFAHPAIVSVERDSPAQIAGIAAGDSLIAYDGVDVVGRTLNLGEMMVPDRKLGVTVRRSGENKDYQVTVARPPIRVFFKQFNPDNPAEQIERVFTLPPGEAGGRATVRAGVSAGGFGGRGTMPVIINGEWIGAIPRVGGGFTLSANGVFGASMMTLEPVLAKSLDRPVGVLVRNVPEATVAAKAGLLPGDIIVAVGGQAVATVGDVQVASVNRAENRSVTLKVVRDKKTRNIVVTWNGPSSTSP